MKRHTLLIVKLGALCDEIEKLKQTLHSQQEFDAIKMLEDARSHLAMVKTYFSLCDKRAGAK